MNVLEFSGYGANMIKTFKISPDAFVQMALQLGVFKMTGTGTMQSQATEIERKTRSPTRRKAGFGKSTAVSDS